ncbi:hypothetical protein Taro_004359 [Colocasia esculenta]|uniref:Uncharacterized protein n=1 Tax=Colocasia esculenta TaxID=4460 RepID=A0A843TM52_COLES|nr:hypothetical protein [Colocasia esculenta]
MAECLEIAGYNQIIDHVETHGQRKLTEALNKDSLVQQKEYPTERLELEELGMKLDEAFSPRILLLLGLSSMSSKPQQRMRTSSAKPKR